MRSAPCLRPQPYLRDRHVPSWLLLRCGRFSRDPVGMPDAGPENPACPDCRCSVVPEDGSLVASVCSYRMVLHRITCCAATAAVASWYHDVVLRLAPTAAMARAVVGARSARALWCSGAVEAWERACLPFLAHLLCPSRLCPNGDPSALRRMLLATRLFLTTVDSALSSLPGVASFGPEPTFEFLPAGVVGGSVPSCSYASASYWDAISRHLPPVPWVLPGQEAEAPWVRLRRRVLRRRGQGVVPD